MRLFSKISLCAFFALFSLNLAFAQKTAPVAVGGASDQYIEGNLGLLMPMGDLSDAAKTGFGLFGSYYYKVDDQLYAYGSLAYQSFGEKVPYYNSSINTSIIPIAAGVKFNFDKMDNGIVPYVGGELSFNFVNFDSKAAGVDASKSESDLGFAVKAGIRYPMTKDLDLDAHIKYNTIMGSDKNWSFLTIAVGVNYAMQLF